MISWFFRNWTNKCKYCDKEFFQSQKSTKRHEMALTGENHGGKYNHLDEFYISSWRKEAILPKRVTFYIIIRSSETLTNLKNVVFSLLLIQIWSFQEAFLSLLEFFEFWQWNLQTKYYEKIWPYHPDRFKSVKIENCTKECFLTKHYFLE